MAVPALHSKDSLSAHLGIWGGASRNDGDKMRQIFWIPLILSAMLALTAAPWLPSARAQTEAPESPLAGMPDHIRRPMRAVDPMTLRAEGLSIRLWGIKP